MNVKRFVKTATKTAQNKGSFISPGYQTSACTKALPETACKNSPRKSVYCGDMYKPTNAQIIAELTHARCVFQLASICCVLGYTEIPALAGGNPLCAVKCAAI